MTRGWALALFVAACAPVGIADDGSTLPPASFDGAQGSLTVDVGTGVSKFEPLVDGADVEIVEGPQGGRHIWTSVRVADRDLDRAVIRLAATFEQGGAAAGTPAIVASTLTATDGHRERAGLTTYVADAAAVRGHRIVLSVEVQADGGRLGTARRVVVPR